MGIINFEFSSTQVFSQLFKESGTFVHEFHVTVDQKSEKGFGFGLRLHGRDEQHIIDHTLVNHTFIHCDVSPPITVSTEPTISTGTHPSVSPTGSTTDAPTAAPATDETVPPDSCSTCDAMNEVADQLNHYLPHGQYNCSRSENCSAVMCESHVADLNLYLGCLPVGMTLESIVHTDIQQGSVHQARDV